MNRGAVQLCEPRAPGADGSSIAGDPQDCQRGADGAVAGIREALCQVRPAIDCAGETDTLGRGTDGSNPLCSSSESAANRASLGECANAWLMRILIEEAARENDR